MTATVPLVDDDAATLLLCRRLLEGEGHTVLQAPAVQKRSSSMRNIRALSISSSRTWC